MCAGDVLYSLSLAHFNAASPAEDAYFVWNARGSQATCSAQGFVCVLCAAWGLLYNCSLNLHSLAAARYRMTEGQVRVLVEPFLHGIPVACALTLSVNLLARENYNELSGGMCYSPVYEPPHCRGREDGAIPEGFEIACGRGRGGGMFFFYAYAIGIIFFVPLVVGASLWMIYRTVIQQEGRIVIQLAPLKLNDPGGDPAEEQAEEPMAMTCGVPLAPPIPAEVDEPERTDSPDLLPGSLERRGVARATHAGEWDLSLTKGHQALSKGRTLLYRALAFSFAYFLSFFFLAIGFFFDMANADWPTGLLYVVNIFNPLQGFFNLLMIMLPRVVDAKNMGGDDITWCKAFSSAFWSRGNKHCWFAW